MNRREEGASNSLVPPLYRSEQLVLLAIFSSLALYSLLSVPLFHVGILYAQRLLSLLPCYVTALLVTALFLRLKHIRGAKERVPLQDTWGVFRVEYLNREALVRDLRLLQIITLLFVVFLSLKHLVPHVNGALYDSFLLEWERGWFGGRLLGEWLAHALPLAAAPLLSEVYQLFYPFIALLVLSMVMHRDSRTVQEFATTFCLTWLLGIVGVFLLPTWGPVFFSPESYAHLPPTGVSRMQEQLWAGKVALDYGREGALFLISGFPSLHFAVVCLGALAFRRLSMVLFLPAVVFCCLTFLSTLYFGWHYLLDNVGSLLLVALARRLASLLHSSSTSAPYKGGVSGN